MGGGVGGERLPLSRGEVHKDEGVRVRRPFVLDEPVAAAASADVSSGGNAGKEVRGPRARERGGSAKGERPPGPSAGKDQPLADAVKVVLKAAPVAGAHAALPPRGGGRT